MHFLRGKVKGSSFV
uniref:Uncharacterized protein n=1 Tax=Arundo donax TaxID=35708 RepID=A0A0A9BDS7_ARUDO